MSSVAAKMLAGGQEVFAELYRQGIESSEREGETLPAPAHTAEPVPLSW